MDYNRSDIFKAAWAETKAYFARCAVRGITPNQSVREKLAYELRQAWSGAKMAIYRASLAVASRSEKARDAINALHNKTRWSRLDYSNHDRLTKLVYS